MAPINRKLKAALLFIPKRKHWLDRLPLIDPNEVNQIVRDLLGRAPKDEPERFPHVSEYQEE